MPLWVIPAAFAIGLTLGFGSGYKFESNRWEADVAKQQAAASKQAVTNANASVETIVRYVDRIQTVEKRIPVVRDRIIERCMRPAANPSPVPSSAGSAHAPHAETETPERDHFADDLANDYTDSARAIEQCTALQDWVKANGG